VSKKIIIGFAVGAAAAIAAGIIYRALRDEDEEIFWDEDDNVDAIEIANDYLSEARSKARELVDYASRKSDELLGEANSILLLAKEKAEKALLKSEPEAEEELKHAKSEIEKLITDYQDRLKK
jgi:hypothetical protein